MGVNAFDRSKQVLPISIQDNPQSKNASFLTFTALHLEYNEKENAELLAERLCKEDAYVWKRLTAAMAEDKNRNQKARIIESPTK
jgi:hypothetical protein